MRFIASDRNDGHALTSEATGFRKLTCRRRYLIFRGLGRFFMIFHPFFTLFFRRNNLILRELKEIHRHKRHLVIIGTVQKWILGLEMKDLGITLAAGLASQVKK